MRHEIDTETNNNHQIKQQIFKQKSQQLFQQERQQTPKNIIEAIPSYLKIEYQQLLQQWKDMVTK